MCLLLLCWVKIVSLKSLGYLCEIPETTVKFEFLVFASTNEQLFSCFTRITSSAFAFAEPTRGSFSTTILLISPSIVETVSITPLKFNASISIWLKKALFEQMRLIF